MSTSDPPLPESAPPRSHAERYLIAIVVLLLSGILLIAIGQTIGVDVTRLFHRWSTVRGVMATPAPSTSPVTTGQDILQVPASISRAADAQIAPPRRRVSSNHNDATPPLPLEPAQVPADPPVPARDDHGLATMENPLSDVGMRMGGAGLPPDPTAGLLQTAAELVTLSWQDFAYPVKWAVPDTSKTRMQYGNHRNRLLKAIAHTSPSALSLEMARKDHAAARAQSDQDPRLDYAFGLVLWKHEQYSEAIEIFQTAARLDGVPFLPAALAVAWGRFLVHDERRGLDQLAHVARLLASSADEYPTLAQREQAAMSIGRALGYLSGPGQTPELAEAVELTSINILKRLPENLRDSFEEGKRQIGQRQSNLLQLAQVPQDELQFAHEAKQDDLQTRVEKLRQEMRDARNEVTRTHQSHVDTIKDVLKEALDIRGQIDKLEPKVKELMESAIKLSKPEPNISVKTMPGHYHLVPGSDGRGQLVRNNATFAVNLQETPSQRATRISELTRVHEERKKIDQDLSKLRAQQAELVAKRHEEDRSHKLSRDEARKERVARLEEQRALEEQLQSLNKALRRTMALRKGLDSIAAYIPWNVEVEGEALLLALTAKSTPRP